MILYLLTEKILTVLSLILQKSEVTKKTVFPTGLPIWTLKLHPRFCLQFIIVLNTEFSATQVIKIITLKPLHSG